MKRNQNRSTRLPVWGRRNFKLRMFALSVMVSMACMTESAFGQVAVGDGLSQATSMVKGYFKPAVELVYGVAAIVGLIGAIRVYSKFSEGDPNTARSAAS